MSSELERLLRQARGTLPGPGAAATNRARGRALAAIRGKRSFRRRATAAFGAALLVATGLGVGIGALIAPSGTAASGPGGVGFLPERGWSVLQNGGDGTPAWPAAAIAANVPLQPTDDPDGLPYATLQALPPDGIVLLAGFVERVEEWSGSRFPPRELPLRVRDAAPFIEFGVQVRPARPLGQYQLLAGVNGYNVDVNLYFGTERPSPALLAAAQRQLDRLVVRSTATTERVEDDSLPRMSATASRIVDRTLLCSTVSVFGDRFAWVGVNSSKPTAKVPASAQIGTGAAGTSESLTGMEEGPSSGRPTGGVFFNRKRCRSASTTVPLTFRGLSGPPVEFDQRLRCKAGARVLVRFRAVLDRPARWRVEGQRRDLLAASGNLAHAALAVRTEAGKPLAFVSIRSGAMKLYSAPSCAR